MLSRKLLVLSATFVLVGGAVGSVFGTGVALAQSDDVNEIDSCTTITESGTYELTQDITNSEKKHCIKVEASNVVLNGSSHRVDGVGEDNTVGVYVTDLKFRIEITDLEVTDWDEGIRAGGVTPPFTSGGTTIENVTAHHNKDGVKSFAHDLTIRDSEIYENSDDGIHVIASKPAIHNNTVYDNTEDGIYLVRAYDGAVTSNVVRNNSDDGIDGQGTREIEYRANRIAENGDDGLYLRNISQTDGRLIVEGNTINRNADDGIHLNDVERVTIRDNTGCANEDAAIYVADTPADEVTRQGNDLSC